MCVYVILFFYPRKRIYTTSPFLHPSQSRLTSPPPTGGTPAVRKGRGTDYHVIHVTGTARDTQRYTVTRDASSHFLSFTVPPFYLDPLDSRYLLFAESPLFYYFFPPRPVENERRTRVANFLRSLTSVSPFLYVALRPLPSPLLVFFFFISLSSPLSLLSRLLPRSVLCQRLLSAAQRVDRGTLVYWEYGK